MRAGRRSFMFFSGGNMLLLSWKWTYWCQLHLHMNFFFPDAFLKICKAKSFFFKIVVIVTSLKGLGSNHFMLYTKITPKFWLVTLKKGLLYKAQLIFVQNCVTAISRKWIWKEKITTFPGYERKKIIECWVLWLISFYTE